MTKRTKVTTRKRTAYCSFCGKSQDEVFKMIAGPSAFICDECVELCDEIIDEARLDNGQKSVEIGEDELELKTETLRFALRKYAEMTKFRIRRAPESVEAIVTRDEDGSDS